jgi:hypothetical protein
MAAAVGLKNMGAGVKAPPPMVLEMQVGVWPMLVPLVEGTALASLPGMAPRCGIMDMPPNPGGMDMDDMDMDDMGMDMDMDMDMGRCRREPEMAAAAACDIMPGMMPSFRGDLVPGEKTPMGGRSCSCRSADFLSARSWVVGEKGV